MKAKYKLNRSLILGFIGNVGVVLVAAGVLDGLLVKGGLIQDFFLVILGLTLITFASLEKDK